MLRSLREEDEANNQQQQQPQGFLSSLCRARKLLIGCSELVHRGDFPAARHAVTLLSTAASPYGDSTDRLIYQFTRALSVRIDRHMGTDMDMDMDMDAIQSSYLSLNQVTPFLRFAHLTANQTILEAVEGQRSIHILDFDFDTTHGVQWPPLLQDLAERSHLPSSITITGTGTNLAVLCRTGDRLRTFAESLSLPFQFHPLLIPSSSTTPFPFQLQLQLGQDDALAVNCVMFLHKLLRDDDNLRGFLSALRSMNPAVVTLAEKEASHNSPNLIHRFMEALEYYTAVFESLEATLPPKSRERLAVEQVWLGREIANVVAAEGEGRRERCQKFERWEGIMRKSGFAIRPLSAFALSQARMLLRLHYPSEGYQLHMMGDSFFLGWQNRPLFSVSSWH